MTSFSAIDGPQRALVALVLAGSLAACAEQPIEETQTLVLAESEACNLAAAGGVRINHYRAILFAFEGFDRTSEEAPCVNCLRTGRCAPVAQECGCTPRHPPLTGAINQRLGGLTFTDVEPDRAYCVGLFGLSDSESMTGPDDPSHLCDCVEPSPAAPIAVCGISAFPGFVEENAGAIFISMDCRPGCPALTMAGP